MKVFLKDWSALLRVLQSTGPFPQMKWRGEGWAAVCVHAFKCHGMDGGHVIII